MDNIYTKSYLKSFLNKTYLSNLTNQEITNFLSNLITTTTNKFNNIENNYLIILILTCINKNDLTYQNIVLINEIISNLLLDELTVSETDCCSKNIEINNNCNNDITKKITLDNLDLNDQDAVKAYFLQENTYLENNGNFPYPQEGDTSIITSGDNMTIPGVKYIINYIIDHTGKIVGIQGYPKKEMMQADYEEIYSDLIDSIFKDEK